MLLITLYLTTFEGGFFDSPAKSDSKPTVEDYKNGTVGELPFCLPVSPSVSSTSRSQVPKKKSSSSSLEPLCDEFTTTTVSSSRSRAPRRSFEQLKASAMSINPLYLPCCNKAKCSVQDPEKRGKCISQARISAIRSVRDEHWGRPDQQSPSQADRREKCAQVLSEAWNKDLQKFFFFIGSRGEDDLQEVCEGAYLLFTGINDSSNVSEAPTMWRGMKQRVMYGRIDERAFMRAELATEASVRKNKYLHAKAYIETVAAMQDTSPMKDMQNVKIVPYEDQASFYKHYEIHCDNNNTPATLRAGSSTFKSALTSLHETVRLLSAKGSFHTCEICNNANHLLAGIANYFTL